MKPTLHLQRCSIQGVYLVKREPFEDARGYFSRMFCADQLAQASWPDKVAQVNISHTTSKGAVRGMHFQKGSAAESKLVSCISGHVWDVVVDLRRSSPTYLQWYAAELSATNHLALLIPEGVAHGFQVLQENSTLLYVHSHFYTQSLEGGLRADDPTLAIDWPLAIRDLSARDMSFDWITPSFESSFA